MNAVSVQNISKRYQIGKVYFDALKDVTVDIEQGEIVCLMGPSGSGKTTFLNIISCIDSYDNGTVRIMEKDMTRMRDSEMSEFRNKTLGFIFQSFNLIPVLNAFENIEYPLILQKVPKKERNIRVEKVLEEVGLKELKKNKPDELSGGQRQRVAIARALITSPAIVIADEPTSALDHKTGTDIMNLMKNINQIHKTTLIFSTHDSLVSKYSTRIVRLLDGSVIQ
jgi:putative ABC transport system ATP-binding protein